MCVAIPALIVSIDGNRANVDFGQKVLRDVNISLVNVKVGDYVIVHAGYAIQTIKEEEAKKTLKLWQEILETNKQPEK